MDDRALTMLEKMSIVKAMEHAFNQNKNVQSYLVLGCSCVERNSYITGDVHLKDDPYLSTKNHPINVSDAFQDRIREIVQEVSKPFSGGKPVHIGWNNTGSCFWFDPFVVDL